MLKLKKLQMLGFKSFCDRTELQFPGHGVVAVVGPNGCGKSNLGDAISWVLGEQSAKSLRGGRMEDVIFAGTRDRMATGMAEVSLTLIDPVEYEPDTAVAPEPAEAEADTSWGDEVEVEEAVATEAAPEASSDGVVLTFRKRRKFHAHNRRGEIVVTRRLYRNGESEYLMNGRPCRLRDIQDLFMGTGLGPESYAIIEQGRIGQILSSKPHERRAIIEEAAGVSKYKAKKRLAEARLEASRQNLARINDIFEEVTKQVGSLKRQAAKAQRYRQLKEEFDQQQRQLVRQRAESLSAATIHAQGEQAAAHGEVERSQAAIAAAEAERAQAAAALARLDQQLRQATAEAARLERERGATAQQIEFQRQQEAELEQRGRDLVAERERAEAQSGGLATELEQAARDQDAAGHLAAAAAAHHEQRRMAQAEAQSTVAGLTGELDAVRRQTLQCMTRSATLIQQISQGEALGLEMLRQLERWAGEAAAANAELDAGGIKRGQLALTFQDQESEIGALSARGAELQRQLAELAGGIVAEREAAQKARTDWAEAGARRRSLEDIVSQHGYSSEAVQRLFAAPAAPAADAAAFTPMGVLGEFLEVEAPYDHVVEQFLHDELNYVVVKSWDQAGAGVGLLRAHEQGRATFLVHGDESEPSSVAATAVAPSEPGVVSLLGQVRALNGFRRGLGAILPKLRDAYLSPDPQQARRLAGQHPHAYFLTPEGEWFHHATVTGGSGSSHGPLSLKRELRELQQREAAAEAAVARHEQALELLSRQQEEAQRTAEATRNRRHELEKNLVGSRQAVQQLEQEVQRVQARLRQALTEGERARVEQAKAGERMASARQELDVLDQEIRQVQAREQQLGEAVLVATAARDAAGVALGEAQAEAARVEERARSAAAAAERLRRLHQELMQRLAQLAAETDSVAARRGELATALSAAAVRVRELEAAHAAALDLQRRHEAELISARAQADQQEADLRARRTELDACRERLGECEVALARLEADLAHLRQSCRDELVCELEELLAIPAPEGGEAVELAALEGSVRELRQRIENLGPINMMALEEFEEAQQRHAFMDTQRKDLLDSMADTQKAIQEMDAISREKFQEAFERINEHFQDTFKILFGGGQGFLRLSEIEGAPEMGVDLVAQPPGKKLQNALLLSGGEKAMTAMALLLAIFRYQPSPFCLLDEVDAPMDEANVARFSNMVAQMSTDTQFILITHNKRTMEAAPTLYGVTMSQPGVSRLVSVQIEEARRAAAS